MDRLPDAKNWNENDLKIEVLRTLYKGYRETEAKGVSGLGLMNVLNADLRLLEKILHSLKAEGLLKTGNRVFVITSEGIEFLTNQEGLNS